MSSKRALVTVIVPCFNAERTLRETLSSVSAQTYRDLEILVIDDGSQDRSATIARDYALTDPRVRLIGQANQGVAAARNLGLAEAKGEYVAPVDADDIWHPEKTALQVAAMEAGGSKVGLVYTWYALIGADAEILSLHHRPEIEGDVLADLCTENFVGNGSSALMRTDLVRRVGGYDSSLRAQRAQGCEDWKICLDVACVAEFRVIKRYLTGYRYTPDNMSSDTRQMMRSTELVAAEMAQRRPEHAALLKAHVANSNFHLMLRAVTMGRYDAALPLARTLLTRDRRAALRHTPEAIVRLAKQATPKAIKDPLKRLSPDGGAPRSSFYNLEFARSLARIYKPPIGSLI